MSVKKTDEKYMNRCIELARQGQQFVAPNPMVGCVIVYKDKIIGEGYHREFGGPHAEVNAINSVKDKSLLKESTLYVSLEPCSHHGKTPPCSSLIIEHWLKRVVIANVDPFPKVSGSGIKMLENAGIEIEVGILKKEARKLNEAFFTFHEKKRPFVILKWAQTQDGFIDINRKHEDPARPVWITNELSRHLVHKWRTENSGIMVGTRTAERDNPHLNVRNWTGSNPTRIVIDRTLRLPTDLAIFDGQLKTLVFAGKNTTAIKRMANFEDLKNVEIISMDFAKDFEHEMLRVLYEKNIQSVIIEGGAKLLNSLIKLELWDEARVFYADKFFYEGVKAPEFAGELESLTELWDSKLAIFRRE